MQVVRYFAKKSCICEYFTMLCAEILHMHLVVKLFTVR